MEYEFDFNFLWGILLGAGIISGIFLLRFLKNRPQRSTKRQSNDVVKVSKVDRGPTIFSILVSKVKTKKVKPVDDTPPDSDWPGSTVKPKDVPKKVDRDEKLDTIIKIVGDLTMDVNKLKEANVSPEEKARLEKLEESNPLG